MSSGSSSDDDTELVSDGLRGETLEVNNKHWVVPDEKLMGAQAQHVRVYYGAHAEPEKVRSAENTISMLQGAHEQECRAAPAAVEQNQCSTAPRLCLTRALCWHATVRAVLGAAVARCIRTFALAVCDAAATVCINLACVPAVPRHVVPRHTA
jgi:hypothetical protein